MACRATAAALVGCLPAVLPCLDIATRRARTRARLGFSIARRLGDADRRSPAGARSMRRLSCGALELRADFSSAREPPQPQPFLSSEVAEDCGAALACRATSARFRSRLVSAVFPRRDKASRRARTSSRLGCFWGFAVEERDTAVVVKLTVRWGATGRCGATATDAVDARVTGSSAGFALVRVGRASAAVRTRLALTAAAAGDFLPEVVSALRRSSASSRLESLAMSAQGCRREVKGLLPFEKSWSPD